MLHVSGCPFFLHFFAHSIKCQLEIVLHLFLWAIFNVYRFNCTNCMDVWKGSIELPFPFIYNLSYVCIPMKWWKCMAVGYSAASTLCLCFSLTLSRTLSVHPFSLHTFSYHSCSTPSFMFYTDDMTDNKTTSVPCTHYTYQVKNTTTYLSISYDIFSALRTAVFYIL